MSPLRFPPHLSRSSPLSIKFDCPKVKERKRELERVRRTGWGAGVAAIFPTRQKRRRDQKEFITGAFGIPGNIQPARH